MLCKGSVLSLTFIIKFFLAIINRFQHFLPLAVFIRPTKSYG